MEIGTDDQLALDAIAAVNLTGQHVRRGDAGYDVHINPASAHT